MQDPAGLADRVVDDLGGRADVADQPDGLAGERRHRVAAAAQPVGHQGGPELRRALPELALAARPRVVERGAQDARPAQPGRPGAFPHRSLLALATRDPAGAEEEPRLARGWGAPRAIAVAPLALARLAARGLTNREIAQTLFVTARRVEVQLTHADAKLSVTGRGDLAAALDAD